MIRQLWFEVVRFAVVYELGDKLMTASIACSGALILWQQTWAPARPNINSRAPRREEP